MNYNFLSNGIEKENIVLPNSAKINPFLLKNNHTDIIKSIDFLSSSEKFLYVHGFMGTGKRQFINYLSEFVNKDVILLEYYCKEATVCDDIILSFTEKLDNLAISKAVNLNAKITTLNMKFQQQISSIKKPFLIILHSFDDIQEENRSLVKNFLSTILKENSVKLIVSTRALLPSVLDEVEEDRKVFLKAFSKNIFNEYLKSNGLVVTKKIAEDFYKYTRGYYYYVALSIKIIQAMKIELSEFLQKFNQSGMSFDAYIGVTYVNLVPTSIRNFFWFLRSVRHGLSLNALAELELYDSFSIEYLKSNLMIFEAEEVLYVQDYFLQKRDIFIPEKTQIKLHKYIIRVYEEQLKAPIKERAVLISRQALRAEIEYHNNCIISISKAIEQIDENSLQDNIAEQASKINISKDKQNVSIKVLLEEAKESVKAKKYTNAIECYLRIIESEEIDLTSLVESRLNLARLYKQISEDSLACHYYDLVEIYYKQHNEVINLNYLYYEMTDLYFKMYKNDRAVETIKKVIYSVDTPQSLLVSSCTLLGNILLDMGNSQEAYSYYEKALDSLQGDIENDVLSELYFKVALVSDENENIEKAYEYYNKCIFVLGQNPYKSLAYSNLASCYLENENRSDAEYCFKKAYDIDKTNNNYEGIYYNSLKLAKILKNNDFDKALEFFMEAKKSAEFINDDFLIIEISIELGDLYYNNPKTCKEALIEYFRAFKIANSGIKNIDIIMISNRIKDMKLRMNSEEFEEIENKYGKNN